MREETLGQPSALRPLASQPGRIRLSRCLGPAGFLFISTAAHKPRAGSPTNTPQSYHPLGRTASHTYLGHSRFPHSPHSVRHTHPAPPPQASDLILPVGPILMLIAAFVHSAVWRV